MTDKKAQEQIKTQRVHISRENKGTYMSVMVKVPGLGVVEMHDCIADELIDQLFDHAAEAARTKLKILIKKKAK